MRCGLCSFEFDEESAQRSCSGCLKIGNCNLLKCPRCGYEVPPEPKWIKNLNKFMSKENLK